MILQECLINVLLRRERGPRRGKVRSRRRRDSDSRARRQLVIVAQTRDLEASACCKVDQGFRVSHLSSRPPGDTYSAIESCRGVTSRDEKKARRIKHFLVHCWNFILNLAWNPSRCCWCETVGALTTVCCRCSCMHLPLLQHFCTAALSEKGCRLQLETAC